MKLADFRELPDLPLTLQRARQPQAAYTIPAFLYRCRYIYLCLTIWATAVCVVFEKPEWAPLDSNPLVVIVGLALTFAGMARVFYSEKRLAKSVELWISVSIWIGTLSTGHFAHALKRANEPQFIGHRFEERITEILEELVVILGLYERPANLNGTTTPTDDGSTLAHETNPSQAATAEETKLSETSPLPVYDYLESTGYFPTIPSSAPPGISDDAVNLLTELAKIATQMKQCDLVPESVASRLTDELLEIQTMLHELAWLLPSPYIHRLWASTLVFCSAMPIVYMNGSWWSPVAKTLLITFIMLLFLVGADLHDLTVNHCNKSCGLANYEPTSEWEPLQSIFLQFRAHATSAFSKVSKSFRAIFAVGRTETKATSENPSSAA